MPFCCQCGGSVGTTDTFCGKCGARQPASPPGAHFNDLLNGVNPRTASLLCYIPLLGWLVAIIVLASVRFRNDPRVRFHAFQGLYLFVVWLIVEWVLSPMFSFPFGNGPHFYRIFPALFKVVVFGTWVFMIIKVSQDEHYKLPILGELAEKSVTEQR